MCRLSNPNLRILGNVAITSSRRYPQEEGGGCRCPHVNFGAVDDIDKRIEEHYGMLEKVQDSNTILGCKGWKLEKFEIDW
mmetsp:Transcript_9150/g.25753  ORF Transcript_9150/g.25753 Transcript_9150/m.25753 type:complete len:80 (-) Transcript_9150:320-559(-)